ncbi:MAG: hypothetical protein HYY84_09420 [Deltaproteobacteria bacterium]|nr:hypothetical protein [Deltaproteobacteria bacterium]
MKKLIGLSALIAAVGCGGGLPSDLGDEQAEDLGAVELETGDKADHTLIRPIGTFDAAPGAYAGQFTKLVLMTDKTFHMETLIYCITTPCNPIATNGRYEYWRNGVGTRFIRFRTTAGRLISSYAYTYSNTTDTLKLRKINTRAWFKMIGTANAWCSDAGDCAAQNLIHPMCAIRPGGGWYCNRDNTCGYSCGSAPPPCAAVLCAPNTHCDDSSGTAQCLPNVTCATVRCASGTYCSDLNGTAECLSYNTCANVRCASGTHCEDLPIVCFAAPCPPTAPSCVPNNPAPCFKGGCSGQLCTDQAGAISTCEWRDEYACYRTATCERQTSGACGWTSTPELRTCLGTN